jgi:FkbM family methyltransferase
MEKTFLTKTVNRISKKFGLEIHRYIPDKRAGSLRSMYDVCEQARRCGLKANTVFDVGVATGTPELYEAFSSSKIVLVEPLLEFEDSIMKILNIYDGIYIFAAASDQNTSLSIHINQTNLDGTSFLSKMDVSLPNIEERKIDLVRLDDLPKKYNLSGPYVIKADVQGVELKVVEGAKNILDNTEMIILETSFFEFLPETPEFFEVVTFMKDKGFVVYDFIGGAIRPYDGALGQIDVAFVKENGVLRKSHSY